MGRVMTILYTKKTNSRYNTGKYMYNHTEVFNIYNLLLPKSRK